MFSDEFKELDSRVRKVEDFILSKMGTLIDLGQSLKERVDALEEHDTQFMAMVNQSCTLKDKEIAKAKEEAMEYSDEVHKQTLYILASMFTLFIGAVVFFNLQNNDRALDIRENATNIINIEKSLDKIDNKLDKISERIK